MAQYRVSDPDELITCPYDPSHRKRAQSFPLHLIKCRKNYTGKDFVTCPFNGSHDMPRPELRHHLATCPSKAVMELDFNYSKQREAGFVNMKKGCTDTPIYKDIHIKGDEDWEEDLSPPVRVGPLQDRSYFTRVQFQDPSALNKQQRRILKDNRLTCEQKMQGLNLHEDKPCSIHSNQDPRLEDKLRLPRTQSAASAIPLSQPESSVYAYSVGCGRGRGRGMTLSQGATDGSTFHLVQSASAGLSIVGGGAVVRGQQGLAPPRFLVPKVSPQ